MCSSDIATDARAPGAMKRARTQAARQDSAEAGTCGVVRMLFAAREAGQVPADCNSRKRPQPPIDLYNSYGTDLDIVFLPLSVPIALYALHRHSTSWSVR